MRGTLSLEPVGHFTYAKQRRGGVTTMPVAVYLLEVTEELVVWPEQHERQRAWHRRPIAAELVEEPELRALLRSLTCRRTISTTSTPGSPCS